MNTQSITQRAVLAPVPLAGRFLVFDVSVGLDPRPALARLCEAGCEGCVVGVGTVDALLRHARAVSGGYYFVPPLRGGRLDWSALGV
jgi:hypothetical protein